MSLDAVLARVDQDLPQSLDRLMELLRFPSVGTDPAHDGDTNACADWLVARLQALGIDASKRPTPGQPMVIGHAPGNGPHVLFYGHYDVQPVDPLNLWHTPPFEPQIEDTPKGKVIRGRGACDDKGQLMTFLEACAAWTAINGSLPAKLSFIFEGEEESGSPSLVPFLKANKDELQADLALICDTGMFDRETPAITTMLRGLLGEEITIIGPDKDLHSGGFGGAAINPIRVLARIIASLHDDQGRVTLPGFYDGVPELTQELRDQWQGLGFDPDTFLGSVGLSQPAGEQGRSALEMLWARPTFEVNGIWGGYQGDGFKTVLPSQAHAKISFRLVGTQDPLAIREALRAYVTAMLPPDCTVEFHAHGASPASVMPTSNPIFEQARQALSDEWPREAAFIGAGGSIPIAGYFKSILDMDSMLIGFGHEDDQIHSPNEKYDMASFHGGIRSWARILARLDAMG